MKFLLDVCASSQSLRTLLADLGHDVRLAVDVDPRASDETLLDLFKETTATTKHLIEGIAADYDADGCLAGIEILDAMKRVGDPAVFKQVVLEDVALRRP